MPISIRHHPTLLSILLALPCCVATDPGSLADIPSWAMTTGNEILKTEQEGKDIIFYIKRVK